MPTLPVRSVTMPAVLTGLSNGRLPDSVLVSTPGRAGGPTVRLVAPAARSWRALSASAAAAGHILRATSYYDSYRPYEVQERIFRERFTPSYLPNRPSVVCGETRWWLRIGYAMAACPGRSNHGYALAVDCGEESDGDSGIESLDDATLDWLIEHEDDFGWSHELQSEPWHIRYCAGDAIPPAVLAFEEDEMPLDDVVYTQTAADGGAKRTVRQILAAADVRTNFLANRLGLAGRLDAILAAANDDDDVTVQLGPEAAAELKAVRDALAAVPAAVADELHADPERDGRDT